MKWLTAYGILLLSIIALPIVVIVIGSLTAGERMVFPPEGISLRWYEVFFTSPEFRESAVTSLRVAAMTSLAAGALGAMAALVLARSRLAATRVFDFVLMLPLSLPSVVIGLAFVIFYTAIGIAGSEKGLIAGHTIITLPFVLRLVRANFTGYSWNVEQAAANLGASPLQVIRHVTLPLILPGLIGGMLFAFVVSFDEVVISIFLSGPDATTLPVRIFGYLDQSPSPIVLAAGAVLTVFAILFMVLLESTVKVGKVFGVDDQ